MQVLARVLARPRFVLVFAFAAMVSLAGLVLAQQKAKEPRQLDKAQQEEVRLLVKAVDAVMAGQPAPSAIPVAWQNHFIKASEQKTFVPFRITIDHAALPVPSVSLYVRAVKRSAAAPAAGAKAEKNVAPVYAFEDIHFLDLRAEAQQPYIVERALVVPPGEYDLYIALKERPKGDRKDGDAAAPRATVLKQPLSVPDFWNGELSASSIIVAEKVEAIAQPLSETELATRPYAFLRTHEIVPAQATRFSRKSNLSVVFQIYNAALDQAKKPDVTVEYGFYHKADGAEKFFNRTAPQTFSASTLQPEFDGTIHQIPGGQEIPLATFPEGEYRLEIKVADKLAGKTLTRNVAFVVTP